MTTAPPSARRIGPRSIQSVASSTHDKSVLTSRALPPKPVTLSKRLLFPTLPADADLPPLLVSPAATPELNAELYDFIALALRAYVNPWWTKITRYDKEFLPEITRILTVVFRALESRLVATDLSPLVFRDLPTLLNQHWVDYRNARAKLHTSYAAGGAATLPQLFHQAQPHMAVSPEGVIDIVYVRQAVDHILKACMPPENYDPETERYIVREVILKVLVGSVLPRVTQPWFIHKTILDLIGPEKSPEKAAEPVGPEDDLSHSERPSLQRRPSQHLSFQTFAIFVLSTVQSVSGVCLSILHAYKQARETIRKVNQSKDAHTHGEGATAPDAGQTSQATIDKPESTNETPAAPAPSLPGSLSIPQKSPAVVPPTPPSPSSDSTSFVSPPSHISGGSVAPDTLPSISSSPSPATPPLPNTPPPPAIPNYTHPPLTFFLTLLTPPLPPPTPASSRPSAVPISLSSSTSSSSSSPPPAPHPTPSPHPSHTYTYTYTYTTARALAHLLTLLAALAAPFLARLLPYLLYAHALSAPALAASVRAARRALFPEGWPAPPPVDPTPEEQAALRATLCARLGAAVPGPLTPLLGPTPDARAATVDAALAPLDNQACNAHLAVFILDLALLTVFPEMGVSEEGG
ncbi:PXA domain-containing protein [Trametes meyenii]|nr:PXA domain-containing protein [Trametes meyenii]